MKKILFTSLFTSILLAGGLIKANETYASELWVANTPDMLVIQSGQSSYTLVLGDTLWAISQRTNLTVQTLADINSINLTSGEQFSLPVGRTIYFNGEKVTVKDATGTVINESIITDTQKVNPSQPVGESVTQNYSDQNTTNSETTAKTSDNQQNTQPSTSEKPNEGTGETEESTTPSKPENPDGETTPTDPEKPVEPEKIYRGDIIPGVDNGAVGTWTNKDEMISYIEEHWTENTGNGTWTDNYSMTMNGYGWIALFY